MPFPSKVEGITLAALTLHNWLRADGTIRNIYCPPTLVDREDPDTAEIIPGSWREDTPSDSFLDLQPSLTRNSSNEARRCVKNLLSGLTMKVMWCGNGVCVDFPTLQYSN